MEHGMNCPHHADKDEACTCALTERTMHAAWRKRAEEAEAANALLRAECEAWRAWFAWKFGDSNQPSDATSKLIEARAATDAAGALKGVES